MLDDSHLGVTAQMKGMVRRSCNRILTRGCRLSVIAHVEGQTELIVSKGH